jgi:hypothetical protein
MMWGGRLADCRIIRSLNGEDWMSRAVLLAAGGLLAATAVLAQAHIPTRYSGSFPSTANISRITGTFTGKGLTLRGIARGKFPVTGRYACNRTSPTQTVCAGTLRAVKGEYRDNHTVTITWGGGQPTGMSGTH